MWKSFGGAPIDGLDAVPNLNTLVVRFAVAVDLK